MRSRTTHSSTPSCTTHQATLMRRVRVRAYREARVRCASLCDPHAVAAYVQQRALLSGPLDVHEFTEGKLNHVYRVTDENGQALVVKHAPPYAKSLGETFQLSQHQQLISLICGCFLGAGRLQVEAEAMELLHAHAPEHVPAIHLFDPQTSVMVMQYLPPPHMKVMLGMHAHGYTYPLLPQHLSSLLSASLFHTSAAVLSEASMAAFTERFANSIIVEANERVVLTEPLDESCAANRKLSSAVQEQATALRRDAKVLQALQECVHSYRTKKEALIHNDLHTGNLLATRTSTYCIDFEFATMGPIGFDLGCLLGVLLLAYVVLRVQPPPTPTTDGSTDEGSIDSGARQGEEQQSVSREQQCEWVLGAICETWGLLDKKFQQLAASSGADVSCLGPYSRSVWSDTLGFAAFTMIRLTQGMHSYPGYQFLAEQDSRICAELDALHIARGLLELRSAVGSVNSSCEDVVRLVCAAVGGKEH